jgi:Flp pilus assembly CpaE family ATPase
LTDQQIIDRVCQKLGIDRITRSNAITFFGADSKVGTTITAQAAAEALAEETVLKIGFLNLSGQPSFNYIPGNIEGYGMDQIKTKIFNFVLSEDELKSAMVQKGNLYILPSVKILADLRYYKPKHVEYLINLATGIFDIVIADAGYYPNSGLFIGALNSTKYRYMVATQQEACKSAFETTRDQIFNALDIDTNSIMLIINRYSDLMPNTYKLADEVYKMVHAVSLPNVQDAFWQTEEQRKTLRGMDPTYDMQLSELIKIIASQLGFEYKPRLKKKQNALSSFFRKSGGR